MAFWQKFWNYVRGQLGLTELQDKVEELELRESNIIRMPTIITGPERDVPEEIKSLLPKVFDATKDDDEKKAVENLVTAIMKDVDAKMLSQSQSLTGDGDGLSAIDKENRLGGEVRQG